MVNATGSGQHFKLGPLDAYAHKGAVSNHTELAVTSYKYNDGMRTQILIHDADDDVAVVTLTGEETDHLILALTILRNGGNFDGDSNGPVG